MRFSIQTVFRSAVVLTLLLSTVLWLLPLWDYQWLGTYEIWLLNQDGHDGWLQINSVVYLCLLGSWLLILIGLFFYVPAARAGFIFMFSCFAILSFFWGYRVFTPYETALVVLSTFVDGMVITMAYLSPVKFEFEKKR